MAKKPKAELRTNNASLLLDGMFVADVLIYTGEEPEITFNESMTLTLTDLSVIIEELKKYG